MKALAGAIIVLAGSIIFAAAVLGAQVSQAGRIQGAAATGGVLAGSTLAVVGLIVLVTGMRDVDRPPRL